MQCWANWDTYMGQGTIDKITVAWTISGIACGWMWKPDVLKVSLCALSNIYIYHKPCMSKIHKVLPYPMAKFKKKPVVSLAGTQ